MKIYVDADSCPRPTRDAILRAAIRTDTSAVFAANRPIPGIAAPGIRMELCPKEVGAVDDRLVELAVPGDLVITRDIPLAARLVERNVAVLDDRGRRYTRENIRERLSLRNFMVGLANSGMDFDRIPSYGKKELKSFADGFDRELSRLRKEEERRKTSTPAPDTIP